jgi:hypothetical protein
MALPDIDVWNRVPSLPTSKVTIGTFDVNRIPIEFHPYTSDETQSNTVSGTYQEIKNSHFVKHGSVVSPGTIRVACELKTTAGSYQMQIIVGSGTALTFSGTESAYKLRYGDYGLGAAATGVVETRVKLRNIGAGTSFNRLYDNYLRY